MNRFIFFVAVFLPVIGFCQSNDSTFKPRYSIIINSDNRKLMLNQCSREVPLNESGFWNLSNGDIQILENNFKKIIPLKVDGCCIEGKEMPDIKSYTVQYAGLIINGKKFIYMNAFYTPSGMNIDKEYRDWKTTPVSVCDGGDDFWGGLFNIGNLEFSKLKANAPGG